MGHQHLLGLSDVGMQTIALRDGNDIIVQQMITNYSDKPINSKRRRLAVQRRIGKRKLHPRTSVKPLSGS